MTTAMRGFSAASLASLTEALASAAAQGADTDRVSADLFGLSAVLDGQPGLRRVLTDASVEPTRREELARSVFGDRVDGASSSLVAQAAGLRWARTRDLGDALEHLGVVALVKGAERAGTADALQDDLFAFARLVQANPDLRDALADPARSDADKRALVKGLLDGKVTPAAVGLAEQAISGSHRSVTSALEEYQKAVAASRDFAVATVRVARPLAEQDRKRLEQTLTARYSKPVHLNVVIDPELLGGIKVEIGDDVIDGTISSRLDDARRRLAG